MIFEMPHFCEFFDHRHDDIEPDHCGQFFIQIFEQNTIEPYSCS